MLKVDKLNVGDCEQRLESLEGNGPFSYFLRHRSAPPRNANAGPAIGAASPIGRRASSLEKRLATEIADGRVIVYPKGIWDAEETLTLYMDTDNTASASFVRRRPGWRPVSKLPLTTIDLLVAELNLPRVDFIKMDIEGAEPRAIRGGRNTLAGNKPRLAISAYHAPDHPALIPQVTLKANPEYKVECGQCRENERGIRPDILFFRSASSSSTAMTLGSSFLLIFTRSCPICSSATLWTASYFFFHFAVNTFPINIVLKSHLINIRCLRVKR